MGLFGLLMLAKLRGLLSKQRSFTELPVKRTRPPPRLSLNLKVRRPSATRKDDAFAIKDYLAVKARGTLYFNSCLKIFVGTRSEGGAGFSSDRKRHPN